MDKITDQLFWQMVMDTIRVVMVVYALGILILLGEGITRLEKLIGKLIVRGCKAIWLLVKQIFSRPQIEVTVEQNTEV
jgi:hypothetical protein